MLSAYKAKICGTTNLEDVHVSAEAGADFFGAVVEVGFSPRSLTIEAAKELFLQPSIPGVALVFQMEESRIHHLVQQLNPFAVQFLGDSEPAVLKRLTKSFPATEVWQSVHLPPAGETVAMDKVMGQVEEYLEAGVSALLLDTASASGEKTRFGGTGITFDWQLAETFMESIPPGFPVWLAGGINPENVAEALVAVNPYGIDLCSGVEARPGKKDPDKVRRLMENIRATSAQRR